MKTRIDEVTNTAFMPIHTRQYLAKVSGRDSYAQGWYFEDVDGNAKLMFADGSEAFIDRDTLEQITGRRDKNGVQITDGCVVEVMLYRDPEEPLLQGRVYYDPVQTQYKVHMRIDGGVHMIDYPLKHFRDFEVEVVCKKK